MNGKQACNCDARGSKLDRAIGCCDIGDAAAKKKSEKGERERERDGRSAVESVRCDEPNELSRLLVWRKRVSSGAQPHRGAFALFSPLVTKASPKAKAAGARAAKPTPIKQADIRSRTNEQQQHVDPAHSRPYSRPHPRHHRAIPARKQAPVAHGERAPVATRFVLTLC